MQKLLQDAALAMGIPKRLIGSHSQRSGGATALHNAGYSLDYIRRFGRWKSNCVIIYLWDGQERTTGVSDDMALVRYTLHTQMLEARRRSGAVLLGAAMGAQRPPLAPRRG